MSVTTKPTGNIVMDSRVAIVVMTRHTTLSSPIHVPVRLEYYGTSRSDWPCISLVILMTITLVLMTKVAVHIYSASK